MQQFGVEGISPYTFEEFAKPSGVDNLIDQKSKDQETQAFFGIGEEAIKKALDEIEFSNNAFNLSPGFQSPGYGDAVKVPLVKLPDIIPAGTDQIDHEFNHGLHYALCKALFESERWIKAVALVRDNILGDEDFIKLTMEHGSSGQKELISSVRTLLQTTELSQINVKLFSWQLGALTYQHAWFIDPGMIEAVGSFKNKGVFLKTTLMVNHWFGKLFLPGQDVMEGYQNSHAQQLFSKAPIFKKALLVKKRNYNRDSYFQG